jgi:metal-responsive CopG/Arc/MetJ family transcriptional regulator
MPAEGTPFRRIRIDDDLWERFDEAVRRADPDSNRSVVLRKFTRWYVGDIDELPQRPEPRQAAE